MLLYTLANQGEILKNTDKTNFSYKKVDNCVLEGVLYNNKVVINRIISTNLKDYLKADYNIGNDL